MKIRGLSHIFVIFHHLLSEYRLWLLKTAYGPSNILFLVVTLASCWYATHNQDVVKVTYIVSKLQTSSIEIEVISLEAYGSYVTPNLCVLWLKLKCTIKSLDNIGTPANTRELIMF
jgi:hypothetical protein